jgi:hypothetical protein
MTTTNTEWTKLVTELQECRDGRRETVNLTRIRATRIGVAHANLTVAARALGLVVSTNGGTCATRPFSAKW